MNAKVFSAINNLKQAIKLIKQNNSLSVSKTVHKTDQQNNDKNFRIQYLGRKKIINGILNYFLQDTADPASIYVISFDLKKTHNPIDVFYINNKTANVEKIGQNLSDLKPAVKSIYEFLSGGKNGKRLS